MIRKLSKEEYCQAAMLSLEVYTSCSGEDFDTEGMETFKSFVNNAELINELVIYGAFQNDTLIGILGIKNSGTHVSLFFIRPEYQRQGIGKRLFDFAMKDCPAKEITVNSSSYAVPFYQSLGFTVMGAKQKKNGITSTPMKKIG